MLNFVFAIVLGIAYEILVERIVRGFKPLPVLFCSIYELAIWRHERYWKVPSTGYLAAFAGTPFINMILRRCGCPDRPPGVQRRLRHDRADTRHHRRRLHAQRAEHGSVPLAGGRRLQVGLLHPRLQRHPRDGCPRPLRRDDR